MAWRTSFWVDFVAAFMSTRSGPVERRYPLSLVGLRLAAAAVTAFGSFGTRMSLSFSNMLYVYVF